MNKAFVLYQGESPIATGSQRQLSKIAGVSLSHIRKMSTPEYIKRYEKNYSENPNSKMMYIIKVSL